MVKKKTNPKLKGSKIYNFLQLGWHGLKVERNRDGLIIKIPLDDERIDEYVKEFG